MSRDALREAIRRLRGREILERQAAVFLVFRSRFPSKIVFIFASSPSSGFGGAAQACGPGRSFCALIFERLPSATLSLKAQNVPFTRRLPAIDSHDLHRIIAEACGQPELRPQLSDLNKRSTALLRLGVPERCRTNAHRPLIDAID